MSVTIVMNWSMYYWTLNMWVKYVSTLLKSYLLSINDEDQIKLLWIPNVIWKLLTHESLFSYSTTANATRKMLSFASLAMAESICLLNLPFRWHPSKPMISLQPPKKPTSYALYLIYILLNLGYAFSSSISICKITHFLYHSILSSLHNP